LLVACAAPLGIESDVQVRESCQAQATETEKLQLSSGVVVRGANVGGASYYELSRLDPQRYGDCLRASGVPVTEAARELELAQRQTDCKNRAMGAASSVGAVRIVFDPSRYETCMGTPAP